MKILAGMIAAAGLLALTAGSASAASDWQCRQYATNFANANTNGAKNTVEGGLIGAGVGAFIAGVTNNNVGTGALIGGAVGATGGAASTSAKWNNKFQKAYYQCMNGGMKAQPVYGGGYNDGSPEWYQACAAKYNSFQWDGPYEGMYRTYGGKWKPCQL